MTITTDIENDSKAGVVVAEVIDNNYVEKVESEPADATIAASIYETPTVTQKTATVVPLELANAVDTEDKRRSELCCGSCCDYLKAVVIVNIVFLVFTAFGLFITVLGFSLISTIDTEDVDDDVLVEEFEDMKDSFNTWVTLNIARLSLSMLFAILGIVGAAKYNKCLVLSTGVWYFLDFVFSIVYMDIGGCILRAFFAYPHFGLFRALNEGHITPERYLREKYCCCDGSQPR